MRFATLLALKKLLQTATRGNAFSIFFTLLAYNAGILCQIGAIVSLINPEKTTNLINSIKYFDIMVDGNNIKLSAIFLAVLFYWCGEALKLLGRKQSISLMQRYARNILSAFVAKNGSQCLNKRYSAIAFKCATLVRRGLDTTPSVIVALISLAFLLNMSSYGTILALSIFSLAFLPHHLRLARKSSQLQSKLVFNGKKAMRMQNPASIDGALKNTRLNVEKISQVAISHFFSGSYLTLLFLTLLLTESATTLYSPAYIGLILLFGANMKSSLSAVVVLSRLSAALISFYDILTKSEKFVQATDVSAAYSVNEDDSE
jgi:hypothetical protein